MYCVVAIITTTITDLFLAPAGPKTKRIKLNESDEESDAEDMEVESGADGDSAKVASSAAAEQAAAQERASKSLEERQQDFKAMLLERGVSERCAILHCSCAVIVVLLLVHVYIHSVLNCFFVESCLTAGVSIFNLGQGASQVCV